MRGRAERAETARVAAGDRRLHTRPNPTRRLQSHSHHPCTSPPPFPLPHLDNIGFKWHKRYPRVKPEAYTTARAHFRLFRRCAQGIHRFSRLPLLFSPRHQNPVFVRAWVDDGWEGAGGVSGQNDDDVWADDDYGCWEEMAVEGGDAGSWSGVGVDRGERSSSPSPSFTHTHTHVVPTYMRL